MNFSSDNWAGAHPAISEALAAQATGFAAAYGQSELDRRVERRFNEIFEREVAVFFVATGTAANSLSMAMLNRPGGVIFAHSKAHMVEDEGGAVEYLTGGARLHRVEGPMGRMTPDGLESAIRLFPAEFIHAGQPMAVSITQSTEIGTVYSLNEIDAIAATAKAHGLPLHMDGARFANALVSLGTTPAEMTWKRGIDVLSFGGTKNGCWCAEAIVVMDPSKARDMPFLRKRAAHLFSKSRFIAAQFDAYLREDHWLQTARHSNAMAQELAQAFDTSRNARLAWWPEANEVFPVIRKEVAERLEREGANFYSWNPPADLALEPEEGLYRFVTSFATSEDDIATIKTLLDM